MLRSKGATRRPIPPPIAGPPAAGWVIDRPRLTGRLLTAAAGCRLVLVCGPSGSGKTTLVSTWVGSLPVPTTVLWPNLHRHGASALSDLALRSRLTATATSRTVVVLDVAGAGPGQHLDGELRRLLRDAAPAVTFVLLCVRPPRLDLQRLGTAGSASTITADQLTATPGEIAAILRQHGVDAGEPAVAAVEAATAGWICGVRLAALALQRCPTVATGLLEARGEIADYLDNSVLPTLTAPAVDLLTQTSVVDVVSPDLARAVVGDDPALVALVDTPPVDRNGFVQRWADGSFRCHPLLRRLLAGRLHSDPATAHRAATRAAQWYADHGDRELAIRVAVDAEEWSWAGRRLVESLAVSRWLALGPPADLRAPLVSSALGTAEPLLMAAAAIDQGYPEAAAGILDGVPDSAPAGGRDGTRDDASDDAGDRPAGAADRVSAALLRMALARRRGDAVEGKRQADKALAQLADLSLAQRAGAPELASLVQSQLGAFELWCGAPERARAAFERGARSFRARPAPSPDAAVQAAAAGCLGQRAWLEALRGELTRATRHARQVLTDRPADGTETGVLHAQLATILAQLNRGEFEEARQRFESVLERSDLVPDPGVGAAVWLTGVRLATAVDDPRVGYESVPLDQTVARTGWFGHQLRLARAEAELSVAQPARALRLLNEDERPSAEASALRARAWLELGDLASVARALRARPVEALSVIGEIQFELIEALLAQARGDARRQRGLIDRALRSAGREQLRTPIAWAKSRVQTAVTTDPTLLQLHGAFLASIRPARERVGPVPAVGAGEFDVTLSERELEILQRLGSLSTNDEIAAALFLSTNTVKTHLKSLYRKLDVSRRSEAFRRGRALGLC